MRGSSVSIDLLHKREEQSEMLSCLLLLGDTNSTATATSGLSMLTADTKEPVMTETTMGTDLNYFN